MDEFLTVKQACEALGISRTPFEGMIAAGDIKIVQYRAHGQRRIPVSEIARLKTARAGKPRDIAAIVRQHIHTIESALLVLANHPTVADYSDMEPAAIAALANELREIVENENG